MPGAIRRPTQLRRCQLSSGEQRSNAVASAVRPVIPAGSSHSIAAAFLCCVARTTQHGWSNSKCAAGSGYSGGRGGGFGPSPRRTLRSGCRRCRRTGGSAPAVITLCGRRRRAGGLGTRWSPPRPVQPMSSLASARPGQQRGSTATCRRPPSATTAWRAVECDVPQRAYTPPPLASTVRRRSAAASPRRAISRHRRHRAWGGTCAVRAPHFA